MIEVGASSSFKRIYKKRIAGNKDTENVFWEKLELFAANPFNPVLRSHKLKGNLEGLWSFSVTYNIRVVFQFINEEKALLIDIGSHNEVY